MPREVSLCDEVAKVLFERVAAGPGQFHDVADRDAAVLARMFQNLHGQFGKNGEHQLLAFNSLRKATHLLLERI